MSINFEELGKKLHGKLDSGIEQLKTAQTHLRGVQKETESVIQTKLDTAKQKLEEKREEAEAAKDKVEDFLEEKKSETKSAVNEWKVKHEIKKLEKRAEKAEKHAEACIALALYYVEETEVAILGALAARNDVDDAVDRV